jgi:RNA-directed DNA polymerase
MVNGMMLSRYDFAGEPGTSSSCPPGSESAGWKRAAARWQRAILRLYLHGMETLIKSAFSTSKRQTGKYVTNWQPTVIRYADDFVILHPDLAVIDHCQQLLKTWLANLGLELKTSKTRISHTLYPHQGQVGFDFLGCTIRQYPVGKTHSGQQGNRYRSTPLGFKTLIKPSQVALHRHLQDLATHIDNHRASPQDVLIEALNPVIRGWANYYAPVNAKRVFTKVDYLLFPKLLAWAKRRHANKSSTWIAHHYWPAIPHWSFMAPDGTTLARHADVPIRYHTKVRADKSPFDGDWPYWTTRLGRHPQLPKNKAILLKRQQGRCAFCGLFFTQEDKLELDHLIPRSQGGRDAYNNWQLLHRHCHDRKTSIELTMLEGSHDKSCAIEEPDEGKVCAVSRRKELSII